MTLFQAIFKQASQKTQLVKGPGNLLENSGPLRLKHSVLQETS